MLIKLAKVRQIWIGEYSIECSLVYSSLLFENSATENSHAIAAIGIYTTGYTK